MAKPTDGSGSSSGDAGRSGPSGSDMSREERVQFERRISELGHRLEQAGSGTSGAQAAGRKAHDAEANAARSKAIGLGFSITAQLVAGVLVGGAIGYYLDRWLGTAPWLMVVFLMFGFAAGLLNVVRTAREMQKISEAQSRGAKSAPDEAEDEK